MLKIDAVELTLNRDVCLLLIIEMVTYLLILGIGYSKLLEKPTAVPIFSKSNIY